MRIRTIKPEFFVHEGIFNAEQESGLPLRLAFAGLWCACDREGRFKWEPRRLGVQILPYDGIDFSRVLDALTTRGFVVKYRVKDEWFGCVPSFPRHQVINNRESSSSLPSSDSEDAELQSFTREDDACPTRAPREDDACRKEGKGKEGNKEGKGKESAGARELPLESEWHLAHGVELPEKLRTPECLAAARLWLDHKREKRSSYQPTGLRAAVSKWASDFEPEQFVTAVHSSIAQNYQGIFPPKAEQTRVYGRQPLPRTPDDAAF